ncbi:hypothetical protein EGJ52_21550 [Pseudomonas luteola]|nr:hypothetical protein EGJ52_21550 [Pseudomonas luteola]
MGKSLRMKFSNTKIVPQHGEPDNALNYRSLRSLDVQKMRFWPPISLIIRSLEHASHYRTSRTSQAWDQR